MKIGCFDTKKEILLAPMAGVTNAPFRLLCQEQGCALTYTEMVSAKALVYRNAKTLDLLKIMPGETNVGVQLFGSDSEILAEAARIAADSFPFKVIDLNMGCPTPKVFNNGDGCALMLSPKLMGDIVEAVARAVKTPVTVKMRKGVNRSETAFEAAKIAEAAGAAAITVHGRFREDYFSGTNDLRAVEAVKRAVSIPVIGNGDVTGPVEAKNMFERTGCDAVMIGRAALGNPWIFAQISGFLKKAQIPPPPDSDERGKTAMRHARLLAAQKGERAATLEMRKHFAWYTKGLRGAAAARDAINAAATLEQLAEFLNMGTDGEPLEKRPFRSVFAPISESEGDHA
ncbi:MAG: tRNA dihydrouridine synthase DusB [Clostridiales bacterium]|jgi:tRNA-dihydrouridine synthase B|nr:tRNA dihydrouridine synthase DusB [Clostridiales bacterium]